MCSDGHRSRESLLLGVFCLRENSSRLSRFPLQILHRLQQNNPLLGSPPSKRLFRLLVSIVTDTKVRNEMCFDRAARVLLGCSADEFCDFAKLHRFAGACANKVLEGEMFKMTLAKPKNGNAEHLRVSSIVPLRTGFQPAIRTLRRMLRSSS